MTSPITESLGDGYKTLGRFSVPMFTLRVLCILGICGRWWLIHRRAWNPHSRSNEDEAMRRHVNRNYD